MRITVGKSQPAHDTILSFLSSLPLSLASLRLECDVRSASSIGPLSVAHVEARRHALHPALLHLSLQLAYPDRLPRAAWSAARKLWEEALSAFAPSLRSLHIARPIFPSIWTIALTSCPNLIVILSESHLDLHALLMHSVANRHPGLARLPWSLSSTSFLPRYGSLYPSLASICLMGVSFCRIEEQDGRQPGCRQLEAEALASAGVQAGVHVSDDKWGDWRVGDEAWSV